ncbi:MAG: dihydroorotate dehydrogenase [Actinobacteria bacterium]|nr:dihydroorotate dehydrogenase [Actinomycetota bacterium]
MSTHKIDQSAKFGSVTFPFPIFTASGCAANGKELSQFFNLSEIGAVVTKSVMNNPRSGRATPRMAETASGMLNAIGLQGPGIDSFLENDLPWLYEQGARTIVSIAGESVEEFAALASKVRQAPGVSAIEVNISCPNVENRGLVFACDSVSARNVIEAVKRSIGNTLPIIAKLSPDVTDISTIAREVQAAGADAVAMINTLLGMVIDTKKMRPVLANKSGGLSGPAIRPVAVRAIYQVHAALPQLPILGMGGVMSGEDAFELILAGASGVSVGTASFNDPSAAPRIQNELAALIEQRGFNSVAEAVGYAHRD